MYRGEILARKEKKLLGSKEIIGSLSALPPKQQGEVPGKEEENSSQVRSVKEKGAQSGCLGPRVSALEAWGKAFACLPPGASWF